VDNFADSEVIMSLSPDGHVEWIDDALGPDAPANVEVLDGRDRSLFLRLAVAVALIAALVAAGVWYASRPKQREPLTFSGDKVANTVALISQADQLFTHFVHVNSGVTSAHAHCFFDRVGGKTSSDIANDLYCGPALFFQGKPPAMYLRYGLSPAQPPANGVVTLNVALTPELETPQALPAKAHLERPDGKKAPTGADGMVAPGPPAAPADAVLFVRDADVQGMTPAPDSAFVTGFSATVRLVASGYRTYYGLGAHSYSAAPGHRLFAFEIHVGDGDSQALNGGFDVPVLHVLVDGANPRLVPLIIEQDANGNNLPEFIVVSVPTGLHSLDLTIDDNGTNQSMSLLTGAPAATNIAVLKRSGQSRYVEINKGSVISARVTAGAATTHGTYPVELRNANLGYFVPGDTRHVPGLDRALLFVSVCSTALPLTDETGEPYSCFSLGPSELSLTPTGGSPISATVYGIDNYAFNVPATFTSGTLTVDGTRHLSNGSTVTITRPYTFTISFP